MSSSEHSDITTSTPRHRVVLSVPVEVLLVLLLPVLLILSEYIPTLVHSPIQVKSFPEQILQSVPKSSIQATAPEDIVGVSRVTSEEPWAPPMPS